MLKSLIGLVVLVLSVFCFVQCDTNVKLSEPQKNPDHPNKCWDEASQTAYTVGSHNPKESCQRIHCYPDFRIKYTSCGTHSADQGHTIEQDLSKDYPHCCAKLVKVEKKAKRFDLIESSAVRISKFRSKVKAVEVPTEMKPEEKPLEKIVEMTKKQRKERPSLQPKEQPKEQAKQQTKPQLSKQSDEKPKEQSNEQSKEQPNEQSKEQPNEQSKEQPNEQSKENSE